ncbi:DUF397 domain-containing protein [Streptomyces sp. B22F1]|uniref:DUF397 domain-containing protein n=1 Tax=Streptomyces sp. B22F1 TaxID=3153566 RepID=UPI00325DD106
MITWRKSWYSNGEGGECVEVGSWRKSSHSNGSGGECVEIGEGVPDLVPVRDSKDPDGPQLLFSTAGWTAFLAAVKNDEF